MEFEAEGSFTPAAVRCGAVRCRVVRYPMRYIAGNGMYCGTLRPELCGAAGHRTAPPCTATHGSTPGLNNGYKGVNNLLAVVTQPCRPGVTASS